MGYSPWGWKEWDMPEHARMMQSVNLVHVLPVVLPMSFIAKGRKPLWSTVKLPGCVFVFTCAVSFGLEQFIASLSLSFLTWY